MTLTYIGDNGIPTYIALSTDIQDNGTIPSADKIGRLIYFTNTSSWGIILPSLKIGDYSFSIGTTGIEPTFSSAEVGNVDASTVVTIFNESIVSANVDTPNYLAGFTITVNGVEDIIVSATRQSDHKIIYFVLTDAVQTDDVVTIEYNANNGGIRSETGTVYLESFSDSVTNNV